MMLQTTTTSEGGQRSMQEDLTEEPVTMVDSIQNPTEGSVGNKDSSSVSSPEISELTMPRYTQEEEHKEPLPIYSLNGSQRAAVPDKELLPEDYYEPRLQLLKSSQVASVHEFGRVLDETGETIESIPGGEKTMIEDVWEASHGDDGDQGYQAGSHHSSGHYSNGNRSTGMTNDYKKQQLSWHNMSGRSHGGGLMAGNSTFLSTAVIGGLICLCVGLLISKFTDLQAQVSAMTRLNHDLELELQANKMSLSIALKDAKSSQQESERLKEEVAEAYRVLLKAGFPTDSPSDD